MSRKRRPRADGTVRDYEIIGAFDKGASASRTDRPRSVCGYRPEADEEHWQAWQAGYDFEEGPRYTVAGRVP